MEISANTHLLCQPSRHIPFTPPSVHFFTTRVHVHHLQRDLVTYESYPRCVCVCVWEHVHTEQKLLHTATVTRFLNTTSEERKTVTSDSYLLLFCSYADH